jgi:asparagine synthase (glutamine-hydrolysing)
MNEAQTSAFRSKLRQLFPKRTRLPQWIDASFGKRTNLLERLINPKNPLIPVPGRPSATRALNSTVWSSLFEGYHPSSTKLNLEIRHPLIDVRLVEYLLSIPPVPWCVNKHILREAMKNLLPPAIINRPKTALGGDPALQLTRRASVRWLDSFEVNPQLRDFVNLKLRQPVAGEQTSDGLWANLRIFALNYWLTNSQPIVRRATTNQVSNNRTCITSVAQTA